MINSSVRPCAISLPDLIDLIIYLQLQPFILDASCLRGNGEADFVASGIFTLASKVFKGSNDFFFFLMHG